MILRGLAAHARFSPEKMGKADLVRGDQLFLGLNCFEPGQEHRSHTHAGQDKLYVVVEGQGEVRIGEESALLTVGDAAFAPSGVEHSMKNPGPGRLIVMAILAPPPGR